jgi:alpha-galactosidase/6-phospho-beta-glucosidase family protein
LPAVVSEKNPVKEAVASGLGVGFVLDREIGRDHGIVGIPLRGAGLSAGEYLFCLQNLVGLRSIKLFLEVAGTIYPDSNL